MKRGASLGLVALLAVIGCAPPGLDRVVVAGAGEDDFLRLRAGPGLGFSVILGLPDGTVVDRLDCVTEVGQLWCRVALSDAPQIRGWVSADYLTQS